MKKKRKRSGSEIYSGNNEENFIDLMAQHFVLKYAEWDAYNLAMREKNLDAANKALNRLRKLLKQEVEILMRFGKIGPLS
jgi:hypothetical protein